MGIALAIDIGGTKISDCLVNDNGEIVSQVEKYATPKTSDEIFFMLKNIIASHKNYDVVAIATAGAVNIENTKVIGSTANLPNGYRNIPFTLLCQQPVFIENDANAAAWAEFKCGAAQNYSNAIIVTLGTGIGGGIIINDKLFRGKSGAGAEIGHIKIHTSTQRYCTCGSKNCFEAYASGVGLKRTIQEEALLKQDFQNSIMAQKPISELTTYDLVDAFNAGDTFAKEIFDLWHTQIAEGLLALNNVLDTDIVVLSGSLANFVNFDYLQEYVNNETVTTKILVKKALFENNSGMIGAALLALEKYEK